VHNLHLYGTLMREARAAIREGRYARYVAAALAGLAAEPTG
ncbi:MAG: tRNA guanosine(34) transglycosylase Tgt, partial [Polyangiaceae bacterium]|nr:tRNA guanosine(34) transglycosylase Tgt [Polyangiaceae bacterium]